MPNIIGIPSEKMIRTSSSESVDNLGLIRLAENYAFKTSDIAKFRAIFKNMTTHQDVMAVVYPSPTVFYPLFTIESSDITEDSGGISVASVYYTGMIATGQPPTVRLPPAVQRLQPFASSPNPVQVIVDFIYYSNSLSAPEQELLRLFGSGSALPSSINGTNLYRSNRSPYVQESGNRQEIVTVTQGGTIVTKPNFRIFKYFGMRCVSHFSEKIGLFFRVTNTYQDCSYLETTTGISVQGVIPAEFGRT
jgi:hypothetical protein